MNYFLCPVCACQLTEEEKCARCENNHSFDKAKSGYINLLPNNLSAGNHGDNRMMIRARHDFLEKGYYLPLRDALCKKLSDLIGERCVFLDAGCGEGWYTSGIAEKFPDMDLLAVDISKDALKLAAKRNKKIKCAAASVFHLPVKKDSVDVCLSVFSPLCEDEFRRIIKKDGFFVYVIPGEEHLWSLKKALYENPYKNSVKPYEMQGFSFVGKECVSGVMHLEGAEDAENLFKMTPYYYKTSESDAAGFLSAPPEKIEYSFEILIFQKQ